MTQAPPLSCIACRRTAPCQELCVYWNRTLILNVEASCLYCNSLKPCIPSCSNFRHYTRPEAPSKGTLQ